MAETLCTYETGTDEECGAPATARVSGHWSHPVKVTSDVMRRSRIVNEALCAEHVDLVVVRMDDWPHPFINPL